MAFIDSSGLSTVTTTTLGNASVLVAGKGLSAPTVTALGGASKLHGAWGLSAATVTALGHLAKLVQVAATAAQNLNTVRITFDRGMLSDSALIDPANYTLEPSSGAGAVLYYTEITPEGIPQPTYVDVTVSEQTNAHTYDLTVEDGAGGPTDPEGTPIDPGVSTDTWTGIGVAPTIEGVSSTSENTVEVVFDEAMEDNPHIRDASNYAFDGGLNVVSVLNVDGDTVTLVTDDQTEGQLYTLTITQP